MDVVSKNENTSEGSVLIYFLVPLVDSTRKHLRFK